MINNLLANTDKLNKVTSVIDFSILISIVINLIIIIILFKFTNTFTKKLLEKYSNNDANSTAGHFIPILDRVIKFIILFLVVVSFLQSNGYSLTSLVAGFGITGLAVGFAAQQTIADIFGTIAIISDKVCKIGDYIKVNDVEGTVEDITMRTTKIRNLDNLLVTIPNNTIANNIVYNYTLAHKRRMNFTIGITYETSDAKIKRAIEILEDILHTNHEVYKDSLVFVDNLDNSSIIIRLIAYVKTKDYSKLSKIKEQVIVAAVERFREEGISFAFPSRTIYMAKNED